MEIKHMKFLSLFLTIVTCGALLSACDTYHTYYNDSTVFSGQPSGRLANATYRATDKLLMQAVQVNRNSPILVTTLNDIDSLETSNTFGRIVAEQISTKLVKEGFNVAELKMRTNLNIKRGLADGQESGEFVLSRDMDVIRNEHQAANVITGTYAVAAEEVLVNLKMLNVKTGRIIAATDYRLPLDNDIKRLTTGSSAGQFNFFGDSIAYN
jgi:TolB-like protein